MNAKLEELGADGIIPKPFCLADFDILLEYIKRYNSGKVITDLKLWIPEEDKEKTYKEKEEEENE